MTVENYHLKWDAHLTHLNTSIAKLYRNDKFMDVMLYSSHPDSGFPRIGIAAHKVILSSSSQFFASIFDSTLPTTTSSGAFHIVLPPELTQRTIQLLVQYMYSGEATVPNDILNEVLKGGELLKISGLCRASPQNSEISNESQKSNLKPNPVECTNSTHLTNELRGLGASVLPEPSPVIVKSPRPSAVGLLRIVNSNTLGGGITVNKEVAIDPDPGEVNFSYPDSNPQRPPIMPVSCRERGCAGCPEAVALDSPTEPIPVPKLTMRSDLHHSSQATEEKSTIVQDVTYRRISAPVNPVGSVKSQTQPSPDEDLDNFQIKEEPSDCWLVDQPNGVEPPKPVGIPKILLKLKVPRETVPAPIKRECPITSDDELLPADNRQQMTYSRLVCDVCKKCFDEPKDWVKHIEGHMDNPEVDKESDSSSNAYNPPSDKMTLVPKKRRRTSPNGDHDAHVSLMCDLCRRSFSTPAEWVRHINTQHTETELAIFNRRRSVAQKPQGALVRYTRRHHAVGMFQAQSFSS